MADERDEQATQVGNKVVEDADEQTTAVHQTQPEGATGAVAAGSQPTEAFFSGDQADQAGVAAPTPPPPSTSGEGGGTSPAEADRIASDQQDPFAEKPHLYALGAFAGAFVVAQVLKRITGGDDD